MLSNAFSKSIKVKNPSILFIFDADITYSVVLIVSPMFLPLIYSTWSSLTIVPITFCNFWASAWVNIL